MAASKDSTSRTFIVIGLLCLVCSLMVCVAVVLLKPLQAKQIQNDRELSILEAAGITVSGDISKIYAENIEARLVNLESGKYVPNDKAAKIVGQDKNGKALIDGYNFVSESKLPDSSVTIDSKMDVAKIRTRARYMPVYLVKNTVSGGYKSVILPFYGQGLWSTMYGYLAVAGDGNTIMGVKYYSHGETPGLGGEIENPKFTRQWIGKKLFDEAGAPAFAVVKNASGEHQVDALSGATLTSNGVTTSVKFWTDSMGYGPYLQRIKKGGIK